MILFNNKPSLVVYLLETAYYIIEKRGEVTVAKGRKAACKAKRRDAVPAAPVLEVNSPDS